MKAPQQRSRNQNCRAQAQGPKPPPRLHRQQKQHNRRTTADAAMCAPDDENRLTRHQPQHQRHKPQIGIAIPNADSQIPSLPIVTQRTQGAGGPTCRGEHKPTPEPPPPARNTPQSSHEAQSTIPAATNSTTAIKPPENPSTDPPRARGGQQPARPAHRT